MEVPTRLIVDTEHVSNFGWGAKAEWAGDWSANQWWLASVAPDWPGVVPAPDNIPYIMTPYGVRSTIS